MISSSTPHTDTQSPDTSTRPVPKSPVMEVEVEPLHAPQPTKALPVNRRLSWLGWSMAIAVFIVNKKLGIVFIALLLLFGKFPTFSFKNLPGQAGRLYKKMRS